MPCLIKSYVAGPDLEDEKTEESVLGWGKR